MADPTVDLWAIDEVHFQQHGSRCRMWVPPETQDPVLLHHPTRHSVGYFGVVRLRDGRFQFRRETDKFNGLTFFEFMQGLYQTSLTRGRRVVVITDNAKYHHARLHRQWREEHATEFVLDYLPPYSPELRANAARLGGLLVGGSTLGRGVHDPVKAVLNVILQATGLPSGSDIRPVL